MPRKLYNGHQSYLIILAKFVAIFELCISKRIVREKDFIIKFPNSYDVFKKDIKKKVGFASLNKQEVVLGRKGVSLAYNKTSCLVYDLCRHIRNSFCHMLIQIDEQTNNIYIYDQYRGMSTSKGWLLKKDFLNFIKTLISAYECD